MCLSLELQIRPTAGGQLQLIALACLALAAAPHCNLTLLFVAPLLQAS